VTWTYRAEQNTPVEEARLGAEVIAPVVTYQGEEVPVGEIFFPETCPLPFGRAADSCASNITAFRSRSVRPQVRLKYGKSPSGASSIG
jgi:hypothetical protein